MALHRRIIVVLLLAASLATIVPPPAQAAPEPAADHQLTIWERIEALFSPLWLPFGDHLRPRDGASIGGEGQEGNGESQPEIPGPNAGATIGGEGSHAGASVAGEG